MIGRGLLAALVCATGLLAPAGTASAYLVDFEHVRLGTPESSNTFSGRPVICPTGKFSLGVGGGVPWGATRYAPLALTGLWIRSASQGFNAVSGVETDPFGTPWHMATDAYCARFTFTQPSAGSGSSYIKDLRVVHNASPSNSSKIKGVSAGCGAQDVIGGGFSVTGLTSNVTVHSAFLIDGDTSDSYSIDAQETNDFSFFPHSWQVHAWAICANRRPGGTGPHVGNNITSLSRTSAASSSNKSISAPCPAGLQIIGGGAEVIGATNEGVGPPEAVLRASRPLASGGRSDQWVAGAGEEDATGTSWRLRARAICASIVPYS